MTNVSTERSNHFRAIQIVLLATAAAMGFAGAGQAQNASSGNERHRFDIPAQDATTALQVYAKQSGKQVLFSYDAVKGRGTKSVSGELTDDAALQRLLQGSGLRITSQDAATVTLAPVQGAPGEYASDNATPGAGSAAAVYESAEIIVTAQKREERLLDVPTAISVVSGDRLASLRVNSLSDLAGYIPGMTVQSGGAPGNRQISLRGINSSYNEETVSPTVATYIDDLPVGGSGVRGGTFMGVDLLPSDISAIEVLKGPQSTLYGGSAMGGLVKYTLRKPNLREIEANVGGDIETITNSGEPGWSVRGSLSAPLVVDKLAVRVSGFYKHIAGYIDNVTLGTKNTNSTTQKGGMISLLWQASDDLEIRAMALAQNSDTSDQAGVTVDALTRKPVFGRYEKASFFAEPFTQKTRLYSIAANWDLGFATLTSATGWSKIRYSFTGDLSNGFGIFCDPATLGGSGCPDYPYGDARAVYVSDGGVNKFVQEIRLASPTDQALQWMVGGFYTKERSFQTEDLPSFTPSLEQLPSANDSFRSRGGGGSITQKAAFANLTYRLTDRFDIGGGVRRSAYKITGNDAIIDGVLFGGPTPIQGYRAPYQYVTTWMANARFHPSSGSLLYARVATGYRPGGGCLVNNDGTPCGIPQVGIPGLVNADQTLNYEIGYKSEFFDRRLFLDVSLFWINWTDIQLSQLTDQGLGYAGNGGKAVSRGFEVASAYRITDSLRFTGTLAYTDAHLTEDALGAKGLKGDQLPVSARWAGSAALDYTRPLSDDKSLLLGGSYRYRSKIVNLLSLNNFDYPSGHQSIIDLYAGININEVFNIKLYAKNIFNNRSYTGLISTDDAPRPEYVPVQPRTISLSADFRF